VFPELEKIEGKPLALKPEVIENLRLILCKADKLLTKLGIEYHVTGGTLLGVVRHQAVPMPFDDDVDICVDWEHRAFLFSADFSQAAAEVGLDTRYLAGNNVQRADVNGAAVRLQLSGTKTHETCDIFFWKKEDDGTVCKVDSWLNAQHILNSKERFEYKDVYPRHRAIVDDMSILLPNNPQALLVKQYGKDVLTTARVRPKMMSHAFPFLFGKLVWVKSVL
jgi:hypothetical protein